MSVTSSYRSPPPVTSPSLAPPVSEVPARVHWDGGDFGFLIPSADVVTLAASQGLITPLESASPLSSQLCGYLEFEQQRYPVFCLNKALQLQTTLEEKHRVLVLLQHQEQSFALACCALTKLEQDHYPIYPVPRSMSSRKQPFREFALLNERALGLSSAAELLTLLKARGVRLRGGQLSQTVAIRQGAV